ncbi:YdcF family protein [Microbacterium sp. NPDC055683]
MSGATLEPLSAVPGTRRRAPSDPVPSAGGPPDPGSPRGAASGSRRRRPRRRLTPRRLLARIVGWAAAAGLVVVLAGLPLYVFPPVDEMPAETDLVYVIGPPTVQRTSAERALHLEGVSDLALYSTSDHGGWSAEALPVCEEEGVVCAHPEPYTTKGEAMFLTDFAAEHGVASTVVLTFTPHVARTRYIFDRCYGGDVTVVAVDQKLNVLEWMYQYAYQTAAFVKAIATPCDALDE